MSVKSAIPNISKLIRLLSERSNINTSKMSNLQVAGYGLQVAGCRLQVAG